MYPVSFLLCLLAHVILPSCIQCPLLCVFLGYVVCFLHVSSVLCSVSSSLLPVSSSLPPVNTRSWNEIHRVVVSVVVSVFDVSRGDARRGSDICSRQTYDLMRQGKRQTPRCRTWTSPCPHASVGFDRLSERNKKRQDYSFCTFFPSRPKGGSVFVPDSKGTQRRRRSLLCPCLEIRTRGNSSRSSQKSVG